MLLAAVLLLGLCSPTSALPGQVVLDAPPSDAQLQSLQPTDNRRLHGRFLHITDLHPDPYYKPGSDPSSACHRGKTKKKHRAGYYGAAYKYAY
ncbi:hypothetical protein ID866_6785 [Astraeus odoratus]|nr:hypothetical protein ID866_6785 [Astraeus odoratus]